MTPMLRKLSIALAISLGLNLFLGGFLVSRALMRRHHEQARGHRADGPHHPHGMGPHPMLGPLGMLQDLEDPKLHKHAEQVFGARRERFERDRKRMGEARAKVAEALSREPPDRAALEAAFGELRSVTTTSQAELHAGLIELAPTMTPEQRQHLIRKWTKGPHGRRRHAPDAQ
jgi:uncharacterized membrane protein